jgi:phage terminase large subunit-like protein
VTLLDRLGLTEEQFEEKLKTLSDEELDRVLELARELEDEYRYDWELHARADQLPPAGIWLIWVILAGRGFGKTRSGAEMCKEWGLEEGHRRIALVGASLDDVRDTLVEGESGLLSVLPINVLRGGSRDTAWNRSMAELFLANGTKYKGFSSQRPDKLRGPQHHFGWVDEVATLYDADRGVEEESTTLSNLLLGLRLGKQPRLIITGTPKRKRVLVGFSRKGEPDYKPGLLDMPGVVITKGTTYDNLANLAPTFKARILDMYEGTRTGRQELLAEILEDVEGALWRQQWIEDSRELGVEISGLQLSHIVVAVDPALSWGPNSDETGIVVAGKSYNGDAYVLADRSCRLSDKEWADRVVGAYEDFKADEIVVERTGGDSAKNTLRAASVSLPLTEVNAKVGKRARANPVASLYEQGRVHHIAKFLTEFDALGKLEEQMTSWVPDETPASPDRVDALTYAIHRLMIKGGSATQSVYDSRLRGRR